MSVSSTSLLPILRCSASTSILTQLSSSNRISTNAVGGGRYGIYDKNDGRYGIYDKNGDAKWRGAGVDKVDNALLVKACGIVMRANLIVVRDD
ncbi:hypothetical protein BHE74_00007826 [Ensete ventricosum]|nr:hypothetical protein BHE74_00007826 [Ensete ventricosum]